MFATRQGDLTRAQRAHTRRVLWLLLVYALVLPPLIWLREQRHMAGLALLPMAILASLPVLGMFASWGRYLSDERDEYQRAVALKRIAAVTNLTMAASVLWGFLQAFGLLPLVEAYWIPTAWVVVQGASGLYGLVARRAGNA